MRQRNLLGPEDDDFLLGTETMLFDKDVRDIGIKMLEGSYMNSLCKVEIGFWDFISLFVNRYKFFDDDYHDLFFLWDNER